MEVVEYCFWCQRPGIHEFLTIDSEWKKGCDIHRERYQHRGNKEEPNAT